MFDKFGEFDSAEEINMAAEGLKAEGDKESLEKLLEENGLEKEFAEMYITGLIPFVAEPASAAIGKLDIESEALKCKELMKDWVDYIKSLCFENMDIAISVRSKKKSLAGCLGALLKYSYDNRVTISDEIVKAAGIKASRVDFGIAGMAKAKEIITKYYKE